jgi:hypothetical protein
MRTKLTLFLFVFLIACNSSRKGEVKSVEERAKYQINLREAEELPINALLKINSVITLDRIQSPGFFKIINRFIKIDEGFILFDKSLSNLYTFDNSGAFIRKIGKKGGGAQEYKSIYDIAYDELKAEIHLLSNDDQKIVIYATDGTFIKSINLNFYNNTFCYQNTFYYFEKGHDAEDRFNLIRTDENANTINSFFSYPEDTTIMSFDFSGGINSKGSISPYTEATSSIIFEIKAENDTISPLYSIIIDENTWEYDARHQFQKFRDQLMKFNVSYLNNGYLITESSLVFEYQQNNFIKRAYYKNNNKVYETASNLDRIFSMPIGILNDSVIVVSAAPEVYKSLKENDPNIQEELEYFSPELFKKLETSLENNDNRFFLATCTLK